MPLKRRFPSQEPPSIYLANDENRDVNRVVNDVAAAGLDMRVTPHHHPIHSDLPLQMPNLTDRAGEKMRPSIYGGVMSGPGAQATTAPVTLLGDKLPSTARNAGQNSSRPPTYQSTQSASKRSGSNLGANTTSFNPLPQHHYNSRPPVQPYVYSQEAGSN